MKKFATIAAVLAALTLAGCNNSAENSISSASTSSSSSTSTSSAAVDSSSTSEATSSSTESSSSSEGASIDAPASLESYRTDLTKVLSTEISRNQETAKQLNAATPATITFENVIDTCTALSKLYSTELAKQDVFIADIEGIKTPEECTVITDALTSYLTAVIERNQAIAVFYDAILAKESFDSQEDYDAWLASEELVAAQEKVVEKSAAVSAAIDAAKSTEAVLTFFDEGYTCYGNTAITDIDTLFKTLDYSVWATDMAVQDEPSNEATRPGIDAAVDSSTDASTDANNTGVAAE